MERGREEKRRGKQRGEREKERQFVLVCNINKQCREQALTIPEASDTVHGGHFDDKGKHVIDECVEGLVGEHSPWEVGHRLQLVVDEQLWSHCDEPCVCCVCVCVCVCVCTNH